jgi:putative transposase
MARLGRYFLPDQPLHVIQRGNNRGVIFFCDEDRERYRDWLADAAAAHGCAIHVYVLMTNHVHLLVTPSGADSVPRAMQSLGRRYVRHVNARNRRTGTLWEGRYRATAIDCEAYFLACSRYIELNPVRARMVAHPGDYVWSSYRAHVGEASDRLVSGHEIYDRLGATPAMRAVEYQALFQTPLEADFVEGLRAATQGGWAFGDTAFKQQIAAASARRVTPLPRGRPSKAKIDDDQLNLL